VIILWDSNLLLYAALPSTTHHERCRALLESVLSGEEHFAVSELILSSVVRVATNRKVLDPPASTDEAVAFCRSLIDHPSSVSIAPGPRHWQIYEDLVSASGISGSDTSDAYLAALAMEHGCQWWSSDEGYGRFEGLMWHNPLG
jgi:toxin-antitoxin system PIN domain toxin